MVPVLPASAVDKAALRHELRLTADPVWWRPGRDDGYRPLTHADRAAIRAGFAAAGRAPAT